LTIIRKVQKRRDTAANWTAANPVLLSGEEGLETDTRKTKTGNGVTAWNSLAYNVSGTGTATGSNTGDQDLSGLAVKANNLSDLASASTARTNLGLGTAAARNVGTTAGTVAAGDDSRFSGSAATPSLPTGSIGLWLADRYESGRKCIPNSASTAKVSQNLFSCPRRLFSNTNYYTKGSLTVTDDAAAGPDGTAGEASTAVSTGVGWYLSQASGGGNIPAGTYTLAIWAKSNSGSNEVFAFSKDNTVTRSSVQTATPSWQRFTYTFTLASSTNCAIILLCSSDGATNSSLQICDFELFSGSFDLGSPNGTTPAGHLYLGRNHYSTVPTVASYELDISTGGWGQVQLPADKALSAGFTYVCLAKKVAAGSAYHATLSKIQSFGHLTCSHEVSLYPQNSIGTAASYAEVAATGLWNQLDRGYMCHCQRYDGTNRDWYINGKRAHRLAGAVTTQNYRDFNFGVVNGTTLTAGMKVFACAIWDRALSDSEVKDAYDNLLSLATAASLTAVAQRLFYFEGDSISGGYSYSWPYQAGPLGKPMLGHVSAVSGSTIASMVSRASTTDSYYTSGSTLVVLIGANDLVSLGSATWLTNLRAYLVARKATGWRIVLCTPTPATTSGFNTQRALALATLRGWNGDGTVDYVIDFAADPTMGPDAAASNTSLYGDGLHPTTFGQSLLANCAVSTLNRI
jgi:hypothetical protein